MRTGLVGKVWANEYECDMAKASVSKAALAVDLNFMLVSYVYLLKHPEADLCKTGSTY